MKFSCLVAVTATLVLSATPVLSQDEFTTLDVDPGAEPVPTQYDEPVPEEGSEYEYTGDEDYWHGHPHLPEDCNDIRIFSARGSDEPYPGRGGTMLGVMCYLFESVGLSCDYEDVVYPANISYSGLFCQSANIGASRGQTQMAAYVERCPNSRLVLTGYSQGGSVVGDILGGGGGPIFGCDQPWNPSMPRSTAPGSSIVAVVTFGDPRFTVNQAYNIGRGSGYSGVLAREGQQLADLNQYDDILAMWCNAGDPVCAVGSEPVNITAHWSYYDEYTDVASRWVVATALGQSDVRLDLDLDGQNESVVLMGRNSSRNGNDSESGSGGGDEDGGVSLRGSPSGGIGVVGLVALITAGLVCML
ncbi:hypothetical protein G647_07750 [Cladophialophora carrionii CBS 160.54]|uniref:Cutinase n=1 Tax=Cladophialophora carrionii CBS 160.54 TaxID=1279043 RepID=V9D552_9EURO|nr:uncharacterized protein G647_07750 [Cladophialophora carrionii CBS 160.54]ETI21403.1 hypothetical protein G647_07750 [Cladophialophora carrionii CBS 160.54]